MTVLVAYMPVIHDGYRRLLDEHGRGRRLLIVGPDLHDDYRPLAKDIRRIDARLVAASIAAWNICSSVEVLDVAGAQALADTGEEIILPAEDISYRLVEHWWSRSPITYLPTALRWDKSRTATAVPLDDVAQVVEMQVIGEILQTGMVEAERSVDWWRRVGAAIRLYDGKVIAAHNEHRPSEQAPYVVGDPRTNFNQGVHIELSTAEHAEAASIAECARRGYATDGAIMYVSDFPCPACAKLIASCGVKRLYYTNGYAMLDGRDVLEHAGVDIIRVRAEQGGTHA